ncbi:MAG TPA: hypothetical protein VM141_04525 [Planctomycetota bacterium]|nr:hypothetical protein [Planctomycetota bacterium]
MSEQGLSGTRRLMLAMAGGVAAAAIGQFLGRSVRLGLAVPMTGSIVAAAPRAVLLSVIAARADRFGTLTLAGLAEGAVAISLGAPFPLPLLTATLSGLVGDITLAALPRRYEWLRLSCSAAALCCARVLAALAFLALVRAPMQGAMIVAWSIVAANLVLGAVAGIVAAAIVKELRHAGVME